MYGDDHVLAACGHTSPQIAFPGANARQADDATG